MTIASPSNATVQTFGLDGTPQPLPGGRGLCHFLNGFVFKPTENSVESQMVAEVVDHLEQLHPQDYTVPKPVEVLGHPGVFVSDGWTASRYAQGAASKRNFKKKIQLCRKLHLDLSRLTTVKPEALGSVTNRWTLADRVAWQEEILENTPGVDQVVLEKMRPFLDYLTKIYGPMPPDASDQLIHGDLNGNILFDDTNEAPPAIIDYTFYWRPAEYATAIIVADGLIWHGQGETLVRELGTNYLSLQLLVRALFWRCVTFAIDSDLLWVEQMLPRTDFPHAIEVLRAFFTEE